MIDRTTLAELVDDAYQALLLASRTSVTEPVRYGQAERVFLAAVMVYAEGDQAYAAGLADMIREGGASVRYLITHWTHGQIAARGGA